MLFYTTLFLLFGGAIVYGLVECFFLNDKYYPVLAYKEDGILAAAAISFIIVNLISSAMMICSRCCTKFWITLNIVATVFQFSVGISLGVLTLSHETNLLNKILENENTNIREVAKIYNEWLKTHCDPISLSHDLYQCDTVSVNQYIAHRTSECSKIAFAFHGTLAFMLLISIMLVGCKGSDMKNSPPAETRDELL